MFRCFFASFDAFTWGLSIFSLLSAKRRRNETNSPNVNRLEAGNRLSASERMKESKLREEEWE